MKKKNITFLLSIITILAFSVISCQKSSSPFDPGADFKEESRSSTNLNSAASITSFNTADSDFARGGSDRADFREKTDKRNNNA